MYQLYEKVPKTKEYIYGSKPIEQETNPFLEGPCLLCISAQNTREKSVFGVTKEGMKMARLRVRNEPNAKYDLRKFPVKFLSIRLERDEQELTEEQNIEIFINTYLVPLISQNGEKIELNKAMKNIRNVNIMSYCDGTLFAQQIEDTLLKQMKNLGYADIECEKIITQLCMFPIATYRLDGSQKSTCISFKDINDEEVYDEINEDYEETVKKSSVGESIIKLSDNELAYLVDGTGAHDIKEYSIAGKALPVSLSSVISKALQNSIENSNSDEFIPINIKILTEDLENIMNEAEQGKSAEELMQQLDEKIQYKGAKKLSEYEIELLDQLDEMYDNQIKINKAMSRKIREKTNPKNSIQNQNMQNHISNDKEQSKIDNAFHIPCDDDLDNDFNNSHKSKAERLEESVQKLKELNEQIKEINQEKIKE